ncbi:hypothetical protein BDR04DRAFT_1030769 [Suillus decipiens]|nr:hypothetical protein BDR04DRAFT_1030769 [Suillus decipiens]
MQLEPLPTPLLSAPQLYCAIPSPIAGPSATYSPSESYPTSLTSAPPALGLTIPGAPVSTGSSGLLSLPSPLVLESCAPSPTLSDVSLVSIPSKRQRTTQSGLYRSVSQPVTTASGSFSPHIAAHWPAGQPWTDADQADWEAGLARVTASAGLPLRWVENPEWLKLCDRFIPRAKIPSAKVLTKRVMPHVLHGLKVTAKEECRGAVATLQCDGWTGENSHHLLGFMMTSK